MLKKPIVLMENRHAYNIFECFHNRPSQIIVVLFIQERYIVCLFIYYPSMELIVLLNNGQIVMNSGRASALATSDAATPTLRRIERAAIAAATPITYNSW